MSVFDNAVTEIENGMKGKNVGIPLKFPKFSDYIPCITKARFWDIGAETGQGKTAFVDDVFLYSPLEFILSNKNIEKYDIQWHYFSYEISAKEKIVKGLCRKLFLDDKIDISSDELVSNGKFKCNPEYLDKVREKETYFRELEKRLSIYDLAENPTGIRNYLIEYCKEHFTQTKHSEYNIEYTPKNPKLYNIIIVDHAALLKRERGFTLKENIDKLSEYLIELRNKFGFVCILIQQFNRGIESTERKKNEMLYPQLSDFRDSASPQQDANYVLGLFNPSKYGITKMGKYDIDPNKSLRSLHILKSRHGQVGKIVLLEFKGSCGLFKEAELLIQTTQTNMYGNT